MKKKTFFNTQIQLVFTTELKRRDEKVERQSFKFSHSFWCNNLYTKWIDGTSLVKRDDYILSTDLFNLRKIYLFRIFNGQVYQNGLIFQMFFFSNCWNLCKLSYVLIKWNDITQLFCCLSYLFTNNGRRRKELGSRRRLTNNHYKAKDFRLIMLTLFVLKIIERVLDIYIEVCSERILYLPVNMPI